MNKPLLIFVIPFISIFSTNLLQAQEERIDALEQRIQSLEHSSTANKSATAFNPQLSVILDGRFTSYQHHAEDYELPGFMLGGEAGLASEGLSLGHTEISASANVDDKFYGKFTAALHAYEQETEIELEEAFVQTTALPHGFGVQAGRFFPAVGYINEQHNHAWDFADAPLVYRGLWGDKYSDDGLRLNWLAPTDFFLELGVEALNGGRFPAGGEASTNSGSQVFFIKTGGDFDVSQSWQVGMSVHQADVTEREGGAHSHGAAAVTEHPVFSGESETLGVSAVYKWAPQGNYKNRHFKLQGEVFVRKETGNVEMEGSSPLEQSDVKLKQQGMYVQGVYQFKSQWRAGLRLDVLKSDNTAIDEDVLEEAGLHDENITPKRTSAMLEWLPSEFSRVRVQFNHDQSYEDNNQQFILQYTMSLGAHGAHAF